MTKKWFKILLSVQCLLLMIFSSQGAALKKAVICNPGKTIFLENPVAVKALTSILTAAGYQVSETVTPAAWSQALDDRDTALIVYAPCETVPENIADKIKPFLMRGGIFITGGGMPFWYVVDATGKPVKSGNAVQQEVAAIDGGFIDVGKTAELSEVGKKIMGNCFGIHAGIRGITGTASGNTLIPLASTGNTHPFAVVSYANNGKLLYVGTTALDRGALNPLEQHNPWPRLLHFLTQPLPDITVKTAKDEWFCDNDREVKAAFILNNPHRRNIEFTAKAILHKEPTFGVTRAPAIVFEKKFSLSPGERLKHEFNIPMPEAQFWGVYRIEFSSDLGSKSSTCFHVLPPAAIAYVDINPIYPTNPAEIRRVTVGLRSFVSRYAVKAMVEVQKLSGGAWEKVAVKEVALQPTPDSNITVWTLDVVPPKGEDLRVKASIADKSGNIIHTSFNRIEYADHNRVIDRRDTMFRAIDGRQFAEEKTILTNNLLEWRKELPLFRGIMTFALPGNSREWLAQNDFTCNYGQIITNFWMMQEWKLDDFNGAGVSAIQCMPGHCEEVTSWLVRQHSRSWFQPYLDGKPDIVNLVEAVAGYESPGGLPNRTGNHSHFLGYSPKAIPNYREALSGRDEGVRMLDLGGRTLKRYSFKEMYEITYDEKLPAPQTLGFDSWDHYVPYRSTLANEGGFFKNRVEELKYRIHYYLRSYCHMKHLDDFTANLRAYVPEIHCVIGCDGPLIGQVSSQYYRLPYIDSQTRWLFRSAFIQAQAVTQGGERTWLETAARFGRRVGAHEEIGGGQWASYRTAETSFVSLFTKRAALPYRDLQVDFYHNLNKTYRVAEEKAMFKGFQFAVDSEAVSCTAGAEILMIYNNNSYYPANYRGNYRWDLKMPEQRILTLGDFTRRAGIPSHSIEIPLWDTQLLSKYRMVCLAAERYMKGDLQVVKSWLHEPSAKGRILFINHASPLQVDFMRGTNINAIQWRSNNGWSELGLRFDVPTPVNARELQFKDKTTCVLTRPLAVLAVKPPVRAEILVQNESGTPLVWQIAVGNNTVIYSGLPLGNATIGDDPAGAVYKTMNKLLNSMNFNSVCRAVPEDWFACGYRLRDGKLAVAMINPAEEKIAMNGPYGDDGDKVEQVAAALGITETEIIWNQAALPNRSYKVRDAWTGKLLPETVTANANGSIKAKFKVNTAKLFILE